MEFNDEFIIANLHHLTHQRTGFKGAMLEPENLERQCPLDNGRHDGQQVCFSLGRLATLPVELLHAILLDLDLQSLTLLRSVNRRIRLTIDSLWQYNQIITHAPNSLRAALSIKVGTIISCRQLYKELWSQECVACGHFGAFLYLLTCSRVCYLCLVENPRFLPLTPKHARVLFGISSCEIAKLHTAFAVPGVYSHSSKVQRSRIALVDRTSARLAGIGRHGSVEQMEGYVSTLQAKKTSMYEVKVQRNRLLNSRNPPRPAYTDFFDGQGMNPYRFMCMVRFPWLDHCKAKVEWGLNCNGCRGQFHHKTDEKRDWRRLYTINGYLAHVKECRKSIEMLESLV